MSVTDGGVTFAWCGGDVARLSYLSISYLNLESGEAEHTVGEGSGRFTLEPGTTFSMSDPPDGLVLKASERIPSGPDDLRIFVYAGSGSSNITEMAYFDMSSLTDEAPGSWVSAKGEVSDVACD